MAFRTQKISQMTPKGADLEATDLIEVSTIESGSYVTRSITGQELIDAIPAPTGFVPDTRTLTINGVTQDLSADRTFTIATGLTVGTTPIASGTIGRVLFQGTGNVLQQSSSLFWDSTNNRLGIGTSTPAFTFQTYRNTSAGYLASFNSGATLNTNASLTIRIENANLPSLQALNAGAGAFNTFALNPLGGNILIGTTTDAGFKLDVNGTARVNGQLTATSVNSSSVGNVSANQLMQPQGGSGEFRFVNGAGSGWFYTWCQNGSTPLERMRLSANNNLLINTTTDAGFRLDVNGTARVSGQFDVVNGSANFRVFGSGTYVAVGYGATTKFSYNTNEMYLISQTLFIQSTSILTDSAASIGSTSLPASAQLQVTSTTKGFLPPRMTTTQKNAIASPATGLQVYDTTLNQMSYYNGTTWTNI